MSRMANFTPTPSSQSEVELYRVLEQARLLAYYPTFIAQGGDDVSQLAEASDEEFREILNLVGMTRKVLHVRRLQKVLQEWRKDRTPFRRPVGPPNVPAADQGAVPSLPPLSDVGLWPPGPSCQPMKGYHHNQSPVAPPMQPSGPIITSVNSAIPTIPAAFADPSPGMSLRDGGVPVSLLPNVTLSARQLEMLASGARDLSRVLPPYPPREVNAKKQVSRAITAILSMPLEEPKRESEIRLYSPIYGRFDSPRRTGRPMTFHEVAVNEASAQLCLLIPSLLTRRDDLFCLARQVVKIMEQNFHASTSSAMRAAEGFDGGESSSGCDGFDATICTEEDLQKMQHRLQMLSADLAEVVAQQDQARGLMRASKADQTLCVELQHELDQLTHRQTKIAQEQAMIIAQLRRNGAGVPSTQGLWVKEEVPEPPCEVEGELKVCTEDPEWQMEAGNLCPDARPELRTPE